MGRGRLTRRIALAVVALTTSLLVSQVGTPASFVDQHVGIVWTNYPGGFFQLHLYPTVHPQTIGPAGPLAYWFDGVVNTQSSSCAPYDYNVFSSGKAVYVAEATAGAAGQGTITGLASSSCGSRTFTLTFSYTGKGSFRQYHSPPNTNYNYVILQRDISATGRFCWVGGTGACTNFGTTNNAVAETTVVVDP